MFYKQKTLVDQLDCIFRGLDGDVIQFLEVKKWADQLNVAYDLRKAFLPLNNSILCVLY